MAAVFELQEKRADLHLMCCQSMGDVPRSCTGRRMERWAACHPWMTDLHPKVSQDYPRNCSRHLQREACMSSSRTTELLYFFKLFKFGFPHSQTFLKLLSFFSLYTHIITPAQRVGLWSSSILKNHKLWSQGNLSLLLPPPSSRGVSRAVSFKLSLTHLIRQLVNTWMHPSMSSQSK